MLCTTSLLFHITFFLLASFVSHQCVFACPRKVVPCPYRLPSLITYTILTSGHSLRPRRKPYPFHKPRCGSDLYQGGGCRCTAVLLLYSSIVLVFGFPPIRLCGLRYRCRYLMQTMQTHQPFAHASFFVLTGDLQSSHADTHSHKL